MAVEERNVEMKSNWAEYPFAKRNLNPFTYKLPFTHQASGGSSLLSNLSQSYVATLACPSQKQSNFLKCLRRKALSPAIDSNVICRHPIGQECATQPIWAYAPCGQLNEESDYDGSWRCLKSPICERGSRK
jgi:hypothetical protein